MSENRREKGLYVCLGYPNSKNKEVDAERREMDVKLFMHAGTGHTDPTKLGVMGSRYHGANLFVNLGKHVLDVQGGKKNPVSMRGMSGGPVFLVGDRGKYNTMRDDSDFTPLLQGIIIEKPERAHAVVAVSIGAIIETLRKHRLI
jgi:hypothetical protein